MSDVKDNKYISYVQYRKSEIIDPGAYVYVNDCPKDGYRKHNATFGIEAGCFAYPVFKRVDPLQEINDAYDAAQQMVLDAQRTHLAFLKEHSEFKIGNYIEYSVHDYRGTIIGYRLDRGTPESPWYTVSDVLGKETSVSTDSDNPRLMPVLPDAKE